MEHDYNGGVDCVVSNEILPLTLFFLLETARLRRQQPFQENIDMTGRCGGTASDAEALRGCYVGVSHGNNSWQPNNCTSCRNMSRLVDIIGRKGERTKEGGRWEKRSFLELPHKKPTSLTCKKALVRI